MSLHMVSRSFLLMFLCFLMSCAGANKKNAGMSSTGENSNSNQSDDSSDERPAISDTKIEDRKLSSLVYSKSNNPDTKLGLKRKNAEKLASKYANADNLGDLMFGMSASRVSGRGIAPSLTLAQKIMVLEVRKSIDRDLPDYAKVEMVLAAIDSKKFELANYFIAQLKALPEGKGGRTATYKAAAWNAEGIMLLAENSIPEAELSWTEALKLDSKFMAARLNLGFIAARYGDLKKAKDLLEPYSENLAVAATLVSIYRMEGDKKAEKLCQTIEKQASREPVLLVNCALYAMDNEKDKAKAGQLFKSILDSEKGDDQIRKIAQDRLSKLRNDSVKKESSKEATPPPEGSKDEDAEN